MAQKYSAAQSRMTLKVYRLSPDGHRTDISGDEFIEGEDPWAVVADRDGAALVHLEADQITSRMSRMPERETR
ncbi:hypothetical protein ACWCYY_20120 [Kitasatospora sp. NPDC001664]